MTKVNYKITIQMRWSSAIFGIFLFTIQHISTRSGNSIAHRICSLSNGQSAIYERIPENLEPGSIISRLAIEGLSDGPNADIELELMEDASKRVDLNALTKELKLVEKIDRDSGDSKFISVVECRSLIPNDHFKVNISVFISVQDVNDNAPLFTREEYRVEVAEELPVGSMVSDRIFALDGDISGPNSVIDYPILRDNVHSTLLRMNEKNVVEVNGRIDFESVRNFSVTVMARDRGTPALNSTARLTLTVRDVDDMNPYFEHVQYWALVNQEEVLEVRPSQIKAFDGDTLNASIVYSLSGDYSELFGIGENGQLHNIGYKLLRPTLLFVHAEQVNRAERRSQAMLKVFHVNDNPLSFKFTRDLFTSEIAESAPVGTFLLQLTTFGNSQALRVRYSIENAQDLSMFGIDESSGGLILTSSLDYEIKTEYKFMVEANNGFQTARAMVHVIVTNSNDNAPIFEQSSYAFQLQHSPRFVGVVTAIDRDANDSVRYTLINFNEIFAIDQTSGQISVVNAGKLSIGDYELAVIADDGHRQGHVVVRVRVPRGSIPGLPLSSDHLTTHSASPLLILAISMLVLILASTVFLIYYACQIRGKSSDRSRKQRHISACKSWRNLHVNKLIVSNNQSSAQNSISALDSQSKSDRRNTWQTMRSLQTRYEDVRLDAPEPFCNSDQPHLNKFSPDSSLSPSKETIRTNTTTTASNRQQEGSRYYCSGDTVDRGHNEAKDEKGLKNLGLGQVSSTESSACPFPPPPDDFFLLQSLPTDTDLLSKAIYF